ncbi:MAG: hypothetical protein HOO91_11340 [Bacteroidales bacterium]|nr:hypothetical protein [Bacteroidales bacterium]
MKLRILFAPLSIYFSHISRCLCIAEALRSKHDVHFIACNRYLSIIQKEGYNVLPVISSDFDKQTIFGAPEDYQMKFNSHLSRVRYNFKEMIKDDFDAIKKIKPDIVVYDGRATTHLVAEYLKIPSIEIRNHMGIRTKNEIETLQNKGNIEVNIKDLEDSYKEIMSALKTLPNINLLNFLSNYKFSPVIIPGIQEFELENSTNCFSDRLHSFVGPLIWNGWEKWESVQHVQNGRKVVLVTLGSTFPFKHLIDVLLNVLNNKLYYIFNIGDNFSLEINKEKYPNCEFHKYLNLEETLKYVDFVVHHGGHGTTMQVLKAGKPSVIIPFNGDHMEISSQIEKLKLGVRIKKYPDEITEFDIKKAFDEISKDIYKFNVKKIADKIEMESNPATKAVEFIEQCYSYKTIG